MIQLIINTNLLREIDERKLINRYARFFYEDENSVTDDNIIKQNLMQLLDWDQNGESGVPIYCSKFESIKRKDWNVLIQFIKDNKEEIKSISYIPRKKRELENKKIGLNIVEKTRLRKEEIYGDPNYAPKRGMSCIYKGKKYNSRSECIFKEGLSKRKLYEYLEETGQL